MLALQMQATFEAPPLDPWFCPGPGVKLCIYYNHRWSSRPADALSHCGYARIFPQKREEEKQIFHYFHSASLASDDGKAH